MRVPLPFASIHIPLKQSHENEAQQERVFMTTIKEVHFPHVTQKVHPELGYKRDIKTYCQFTKHQPSKPYYFLSL